MRVLITGGSGYVGSVVCERLAQSHEVINFDQRPPEKPCGRFMRGDILDAAHLTEAMHGVEVVVHLAAVPNPLHVPTDTLMNVNVMGTQRVVATAAHGDPERVVVASSDATFGFVFGRGEIMPEYLPVDETHPTRPLDCYGLSKVLKEEICRRYTRDTGLETVCLRYCWVWSQQHYTELDRLADAAESFVGQLWGYVDVRDVAQAVERSLTAPSIIHETLLITASNTFQRLASLELAERFLPPSVEIRDPDWFAQQPQRSLFDCARAKAVLGFEPELDCWEEARRSLSGDGVTG